MKKNKIAFIFFTLLAATCGYFMLSLGLKKTLDVRLFYSLEEAYSWLSSLTPAQRADYLLNEYLDVGYLIGYSGIFFLLTGPIGLIPGVLDLFETIPIILHLKFGIGLPFFLGFVSGMKWIAGVIVGLMILRKYVPQYLGRNKSS